MSEHAKEPWRVIVDEGEPGNPRYDVAYVIGQKGIVAGDVGLASAKRIVQCVNACAGIEDPVAYERAVIEKARFALELAETLLRHRGSLEPADECEAALSALTPNTKQNH